MMEELLHHCRHASSNMPIVPLITKCQNSVVPRNLFLIYLSLGGSMVINDHTQGIINNSNFSVINY